jgi:hypothetical protein
VEDPTHRQAVVNATDGSITYSPDLHYHGSDSFVGQACDSQVLCATTLVSVTVIPRGPSAQPDAATCNYTSSVVINVLANDLAGAAPIVNAAITVPPSADQGTAILQQDNTILFIAAENWAGTASFEYQCCDSSNPSPLCSHTTVWVSVAGLPPIAIDDVATINEDLWQQAELLVITVLPNDNVLGAALNRSTLVIKVAPNAGSQATPNPDGTVSYRPPALYYGLETFIYRVCDLARPNSLCSSVQVNVMILEQPPTAQADAVSVGYMGTVAMNVIGNDAVGPAGIVRVTICDAPSSSEGSVVVNLNLTISFMAHQNFDGTSLFNYSVCNTETPTPQCANSTITIHITPLPPTANDDLASTTYRAPVTIDVLANDVKGAQPIQASAITSTADTASVTYDGKGNFTYTPPALFSGVYSFVYTQCDDSKPKALCSNATVSITVRQPYPPICSKAGYQTPEAIPLASSILATTQVGYAALDLSSLKITSAPSNGSTTLLNDVIRYIPRNYYYGPDAFEYRVCDALQLCCSATISFEISPVGPTAQNISVPVGQNRNASVFVLDYAMLGPAPVKVTISTPPNISEGTATLLSDGTTIAFTPAHDYNGPASLAFTLCDESDPQQLCSTAWVTYTIVMTDPTAQVDEDGSAIRIEVLGNNEDGSVPINVSSVMLSRPFAHGTAFVDPVDGSVHFTPEKGYYGTDNATYDVCDRLHPTPHCTTKIPITVTIRPVYCTADDVSASTMYNTPVTISVLQNVTAHAQPIDTSSVTLLTQPVAGSTTIVNVDGSITYSPGRNFTTGLDTLKYRACDKSKLSPLCCEGHVTINVRGIGPKQWVLRF